jgi:hypothetical protein
MLLGFESLACVRSNIMPVGCSLSLPVLLLILLKGLPVRITNHELCYTPLNRLKGLPTRM